ncbi:MAG: CheR family methyltransferase [Planctomycetaceae bacterium]
MTIEATAALLRDWIGLDAATIGLPSLTRAIRGRMEVIGVTDADAYASLVRGDVAERDRLVEDVIVAESWFFRDRQIFDFVADIAATRVPLPGGNPFRILCAPCASGEEPFSVAMALLDAGLQSDQFVIDAVDVSRAALERAARGRYSPNAFRNADSTFRDRWFRMEGSTAVIDDRVRAGVRFAWANLLDARFATGRDAYDVIFCRNLLIYLTTEARTQVEKSLERLLRHDGILVLGAAEPPILRGDWIPAGAASLFALRRGVHLPATRPPPAAAPRRPAPAAASPAPAHTVPPPTGVAPPVATRPTEQPPSLGEVLDQASALANARRHLDALALCERHRASLPPAPELFFLMGMLHQSLGDLDRAEGCLHKTLYLDADNEEALLALALLARQRGDLRMAETYRQSAARAFARKGSP